MFYNINVKVAVYVVYPDFKKVSENGGFGAQSDLTALYLEGTFGPPSVSMSRCTRRATTS